MATKIAEILLSDSNSVAMETTISTPLDKRHILRRLSKKGRSNEQLERPQSFSFESSSSPLTPGISDFPVYYELEIILKRAKNLVIRDSNGKLNSGNSLKWFNYILYLIKKDR